DNNEHEDGGINFYIGFVGPLGGFGNNKRVKVDISRSETLEFEPVLKDTIIEYSDLEDHKLLCYPLEELLVEKLRCTMQRMQPRDYYDIWYLVEIEGMDVEYYTNEFWNECTSKELKPEDFHAKLEQKIPLYKARWANSRSEEHTSELQSRENLVCRLLL